MDPKPGSVWFSSCSADCLAWSSSEDNEDDILVDWLFDFFQEVFDELGIIVHVSLKIGDTRILDCVEDIGADLVCVGGNLEDVGFNDIKTSSKMLSEFEKSG